MGQQPAARLSETPVDLVSCLIATMQIREGHLAGLNVVIGALGVRIGLHLRCDFLPTCGLFALVCAHDQSPRLCPSRSLSFARMWRAIKVLLPALLLSQAV
jgi:hypothetical protein